METDRRAVLTVRAAISGAVDFRRAQLQDGNWWRKVNLIINTLADRDDERLLDNAYRYHLALLSNGVLTPDSFNAAKKNALELFNDLTNLIHPWDSSTSDERQQEEYRQLAEAYKQSFGDMNDPVFRRQLEADVAATLAQKPEGSDSPEDKINQRFRDRIMRR